jgi:hypothetical protein
MKVLVAIPDLDALTPGSGTKIYQIFEKKLKIEHSSVEPIVRSVKERPLRRRYAPIIWLREEHPCAPNCVVSTSLSYRRQALCHNDVHSEVP